MREIPQPGNDVLHAVDAVFESSFRALSADELDQLGELLDAALGPDPTAW